MDIFSYFDEEILDIEKKLTDVTANYKSYTTEQVFDKVKVVCDSIMAHLKKQDSLLLSNIDKTPEIEGLMVGCQKDRAKIEEEIGQLVMVHVNEPEYDDYLANLLKVIEEHMTFSRTFYKNLKQHVSESQLAKINEQLTQMLLHSTDFNTLQTGV